MAKAETAWELLEQVCVAIAAHPLNYYQPLFLAQRGNKEWPLPNELNAPENECGTAYCRAGFMVHVYDGPPTDYGLIEPRAQTLLGVEKNQLGDFYDAVEELFDPGDVVGIPGTYAYAAQGVAGLREFMVKHEAHLKARSLKGV